MTDLSSVNDSSSLKPFIARVVVLVLIAVAITAVWTPSLAREPSGMVKPPAADDGALFEAVVNRVRAGESYYAAMGNELRSREYPAGSVFNWRTPLLYIGFAAAPWARPWVLIFLGTIA